MANVIDCLLLADCWAAEEPELLHALAPPRASPAAATANAVLL